MGHCKGKRRGFFSILYGGTAKMDQAPPFGIRALR
jgi:hypothetical protein